ncbi:MAG: hypothetical protein MRJ92_10405 [Nitrospira sp.]|nr:hypothetical protein [Nitrospira sp.]
MLKISDAKLGGFGGAPKFPPATGLSLLLHGYHRTKDPQTLTMVRTTLDAWRDGGIHDHIGGGFARYSTDERWLVPHFEKMLTTTRCSRMSTSRLTRSPETSATVGRSWRRSTIFLAR